MHTLKRRLENKNLRQLGALGFAFFFVKGMAWLIAPLVFLWM